MATNNNLIPININDLPKLDILSNSDLIPIETVEGTATILYRDFIIDEAHVTFAATLSASVTSAINLSAAIDATNATVKTVSASLYSSITALSSSSFAYSNALSSQLTTLNATVTALSANVNSLSTTVASNTTNIATLSTSVGNLQATVVAVTGLQSTHFVLTTSPGSKGSIIEPFFTSPNGVFSLEGSKAYRLAYNLWYTKNSTGTVTFTMSSNTVLNTIAGRIIHSRLTGSDTIYGVTSGALMVASGVSIDAFPATTTIVDAQDQFVDINIVLQTNAAAPIVTLAVTCSTGTVTPIIGSTCTVTKLN
jgi:hypothetical protein